MKEASVFVVGKHSQTPSAASLECCDWSFRERALWLRCQRRSDGLPLRHECFGGGQAGRKVEMWATRSVEAL